MSSGKELLHKLGNRNWARVLEDEGKTEEEITLLLLEMDEDISLNSYSSEIPLIIKIILNNYILLQKCNGQALSWLLRNPEVYEKIMSDNTLIRKVNQDSLAIEVRDKGVQIWQRIKEAKADNFEDGNHFCWAARNSEEVALEIISDDEKIKKIITQSLSYDFYKHEKVALALIKNPIFIQNVGKYSLSQIAHYHESCAAILFEKINEIIQLQNFSNGVRESLRNKYSFWKQENRGLNSEELQYLARDRGLQRALQENPNLVNYQDEHGRTLLHYVAENGYGMGSTSLSEILNLLWAMDISFEIQDENGDTPLHRVARTIHERVSSSYTMPQFLQEAQSRNTNLLITNNQGQTFIDVLNQHSPSEYYTSRGFPHLYMGTTGRVLNGNQQPVDDNDQRLQDTISISFNFQQPNNNAEITDRDIVNVNEFLKAELSATHGFFYGELKKLPLNEQLEIISYIITKHSEEGFQENPELENKISELDDWKVMLSINDAIKIITKKEPIAQQITQVREQFLKNLKECKSDLRKSMLQTERQIEIQSSFLLYVCRFLDEISLPVAFFIPIIGQLYFGARLANDFVPLTKGNYSFFGSCANQANKESEECQLDWNFAPL